MRLSDFHQDALTELFTIGVGRAAPVLNQMLDTHVLLDVPTVRVIPASDLLKEIPARQSEKIASVQMEFSGQLRGMAAALFPPQCANNLVAALSGTTNDSPDLESIRAGTLAEVGNIVLNGVMGSIGNSLGTRLDYMLPVFEEETISNLMCSRRPDRFPVIIVGETQFTVEAHEVSGRIHLILDLDSFDRVSASLNALASEA